MIGLGHLLLPAAYFLASFSGCQGIGPATVDVHLTYTEPPYYTDMTSSELTSGFANNPDSTLTTDGNWMIGGLTLSQLTGQYGVNFKTVTYPTGQVCLAVSEVDMDIVYTPVIYIAKDFLRQECQYTVTKAHEQKHVATDLETINDFTPQLKQQLQEFVDSLGVQGPISRDEVEQAQQAITQAVDEAAAPIVQQLIDLRRERQGSIDTIENYKRESALCPGEFPSFSGEQ